MTRLGSALQSTDSIRLKTFELGGHVFRVRIPLTKEMEAIEQRINNIDAEEEQRRFDKMVAGFKDADIEGVDVVDGDVIVDGRSTRELVQTVLKMESRIVEFIKLLVPTDGFSLDDLTYQDVEDEWPMSVQLQILAKINEVISPGYKEERKN